jgi:hypothetical protein
MLKFSLLVMLGLTVLIAIGLRWRDERVAALQPARRPPRGLVAGVKAKANRWVTAAALAALATIVLFGGLHWLRVLTGG